jgi:Uma2 family endonuclease
MSALPELNWTAQRYLEYERTSDERHEYLNGQIYALAGASANHNLIVGNVYASLHAQLRKRPCVTYPSDMRLKIKQTGLYTYPDISVVCGAPEFEDDKHDTLLNPILLIEVLSPSTENYDRGKKFQHYRTLESLHEFLLIAQDSYRVEHYVRQENDQWLLTDINQSDAVLELGSIDCKLVIAELYEKVAFES